MPSSSHRKTFERMIVKVATARNSSDDDDAGDADDISAEGKQAEGDVGLIGLRNLVPDIFERGHHGVGRGVGVVVCDRQETIANGRWSIIEERVCEAHEIAP